MKWQLSLFLSGSCNPGSRLSTSRGPPNLRPRTTRCGHNLMVGIAGPQGEVGPWALTGFTWMASSSVQHRHMLLRPRPDTPCSDQGSPCPLPGLARAPPGPITIPFVPGPRPCPCPQLPARPITIPFVPKPHPSPALTPTPSSPPGPAGKGQGPGCHSSPSRPAPTSPNMVVPLFSYFSASALFPGSPLGFGSPLALVPGPAPQPAVGAPHSLPSLLAHHSIRWPHPPAFSLWTAGLKEGKWALRDAPITGCP